MSDDAISTDPADYVYADTAFGGVNRRNNVRKHSEIRLPFVPVDCYASYGRATRSLLEWRNTHTNKDGKPTVAGFDGPTWTPFLPLDFDYVADLAVALGWLRRTLDWLEAAGVELGAVRVFFSGYKGFGLEMPHTLFGGFVPSVALPDRLHRAAESIMAGFRSIRPSTTGCGSGGSRAPATARPASTKYG
jgi:hypothetical protein